MTSKKRNYLGKVGGPSERNQGFFYDLLSKEVYVYKKGFTKNCNVKFSDHQVFMHSLLEIDFKNKVSLQYISK